MRMIKIHNVETGEIIEREMNETELAQWELDQQRIADEARAQEVALAAKAALLEKLGITEKEAKLLLS